MQIFQIIWTALTTENKFMTGLGCIPFVYIEITLTILLSNKLLNLNISKKNMLLFILILPTISNISTFLFSDTIRIVINLIALLIFTTFILKLNLFKGVLIEFLPMLFMLISETIWTNFANIIFNISSDKFATIPLYRLVMSCLDYTFMFLVYTLVKKYNLNITLFDNIDGKAKTILTLNFIIGVIAISTQLYLVSFYTAKLPFFITIVGLFSLLAYFTISMYSLANTSKLVATTTSLIQEKEHNRILKIAQDDIRGFRHDFSNIICTISGYVHSKDMDGLENYFGQIQNDVVKVNNLTALTPDIINNPAIYALVTAKYDKASNLNIKMSVEVFMDLNIINMQIYEFTRILGILLDNAIEAADECDERNVYVHIRNDQRHNRQLLIIENTYKDKNINTDKIYEKNYSTKPKNTGLGLWEVRQILKRNNNLNLYTTKTERLFKQQLEIYNI